MRRRIRRLSRALFDAALRKPRTGLIDKLVSSGVPFYLLPLQLNSDAQIRDHCRFDDMNGVMEFVMESFARMRRRRGW
ncbi:MAG: hypothetical protein V5B30_14170 [Candidatus Accumulibacter delftensis]|jgi:capsule polysaccharide modification protein KpsS